MDFDLARLNSESFQSCQKTPRPSGLVVFYNFKIKKSIITQNILHKEIHICSCDIKVQILEANVLRTLHSLKTTTTYVMTQQFQLSVVKQLSHIRVVIRIIK